MQHPIPKRRQFYSKSSIEIFLICLFLSFSFWVSIKLSNKYTEVISYKVDYKLPFDKVFYKPPRHRLSVQQQGSGYSLLMNKFYNSISIDLSEVIHSNSQGYYWLPGEQLRAINESIGDAQVISISPDELKLPIANLASKIVPVRADIKINCREGFKEKKLSIDYQQINITGPSNILDAIQFISTEKWVSDPLDADFHKYLKLKLPRHIKSDISKLKLDVEIERYTEDTIKLPVHVLNAYPKTRIQLFPDNVKLSFKVGYHDYKKTLPSDFSVVCDLSQLQDEINVLPLKLVKAPSYLKDIKIIPDKVEVILVK